MLLADYNICLANCYISLLLQSPSRVKLVCLIYSYVDSMNIVIVCILELEPEESNQLNQ